MAKSSSLSITAAVAALVAAASAAGHTITEDKAREMVKANSIKSMKRVTEAVASLSKPRRIRSERIIEAGPRGFRFDSKAWLSSVRTQSGIAVHPSNLPKLKAHAKSVGVSAAGTDSVAIAALIAAAPAPAAE